MNVKRVGLLVIVKQDPRQGMLFTPTSTLDVIQEALNGRMPHYKPTTTLLLNNEVPVRGHDQAYLVNVDLDAVPGTMHTVESAAEIVRNIIFQRVPEFKPQVSLASPVLQSS